MTHELSVVAAALVDLADTLGDGFDLAAHLTGLCARLVDVLHADGAAVLLVSDAGELLQVASSDEASRLLELFEVQHHEGPCIECQATGTPLVNEPLEGSLRWPAFAAAAATNGFCLAHTFPVAHRGEVLGAVDIFAIDPEPVPVDSVLVAHSMVGAATIGLQQLRARNRVELVNGQLEQALASRVVIEQAKGLLAGRYGIQIDAAFDAIRRFARAHETKIADVARGIIDGTLDGAQLVA